LAYLGIQQGCQDPFEAPFAAMMITTIPTLVVYILFQRRLEFGLTADAH